MKNSWTSTSIINEWFSVGMVLANKLKDQSLFELMRNADEVDNKENEK